jgi:hypothetical protein
MVRNSERAGAIKDFDNLLMMLLSSGENDTEEFENLMEIRALMEYTRYFNERNLIPKNRSIVISILDYPDRQFRDIVRMDKLSFKVVVDLINNHPIFHNNSRHKQADVWIQLMVGLQRLGCDGNGVSCGRIAVFFGISEGAVISYTRRVIIAIFSLQAMAVTWPDTIERLEISKRLDERYGLLGAVGIIDGTPIVLGQRPEVDGEVFFNRKQRYAINLQLCCDDNKFIRNYVVGWPGSVTDSVVWADSNVMKHPTNFLSYGQWLIADAGYALSSIVCTPYRQPSSEIEDNKRFNDMFSSARSSIEHTNGMLKGRWGSLRNLRTTIKTKEDLIKVNEWIVVCIILHNILLKLKDVWNEEYINEEEADDHIINTCSIIGNNLQGNNLRMLVQQRVLEKIRNTYI